MEPNDKAKLEEILGPLYLLLGQDLGNRKILKIFIICNNVDGIDWTFQVVSPNLESFKDSKQFFVMHVVVQLYHGKSIGVKSHWMNFIFLINNRKDHSKSIVQSISFHNELSIGNPISEDRSRDECLLERIESITIGGVELPRDILPDKAYQWNDNI